MNSSVLVVQVLGAGEAQLLKHACRSCCPNTISLQAAEAAEDAAIPRLTAGMLHQDSSVLQGAQGGWAQQVLTRNQHDIAGRCIATAAEPKLCRNDRHMHQKAKSTIKAQQKIGLTSMRSSTMTASGLDDQVRFKAAGAPVAGASAAAEHIIEQQPVQLQQ